MSAPNQQVTFVPQTVAFAVDGNRTYDQPVQHRYTGASAVNVTVDQAAAGDRVEIVQKGAGQLTMVAGTGVTLVAPAASFANTANGAITAEQECVIVLTWTSATTVEQHGGMELAGT